MNWAKISNLESRTFEDKGLLSVWKICIDSSLMRSLSVSGIELSICRLLYLLMYRSHPCISRTPIIVLNEGVIVVSHV